MPTTVPHNRVNFASLPRISSVEVAQPGESTPPFSDDHGLKFGSADFHPNHKSRAAIMRSPNWTPLNTSAAAKNVVRFGQTRVRGGTKPFTKK